MNNELFERLLYEEESPLLDFKRDQYPFAKVTKDEKSELLKDILGFANAWRRTEAYILIGVDEVRGGRSEDVGIDATDQLDDHSLQQFVNNLTNRPVLFHYEVFGFQNKQFGIIRIELQQRPIYLKCDYGKLNREAVYVRRGSSTDPTKPASPDEISQMRESTLPTSAELTVHFAHIQKDESLGNKIELEANYCEIAADEEIPDLASPSVPLGGSFGIRIPIPGSYHNPEFFRELAEFEFARRLFRPVRLLVKNVGGVAASNVRCEFVIPRGIGIHVIESSEMPSAPKQHSYLGSATIPRIKPAFQREPGDLSIDMNDDRYRIEIDCGDLQPSRRVWSELFYFGMVESGEMEICGNLLADNLPEPQSISLKISMLVEKTSMSVDELCELPEPSEIDEET